MPRFPRSPRPSKPPRAKTRDRSFQAPRRKRPGAFSCPGGRASGPGGAEPAVRRRWAAPGVVAHDPAKRRRLSAGRLVAGRSGWGLRLPTGPGKARVLVRANSALPCSRDMIALAQRRKHGGFGWRQGPAATAWNSPNLEHRGDRERIARRIGDDGPRACRHERPVSVGSGSPRGVGSAARVGLEDPMDTRVIPLSDIGIPFQYPIYI